MQPLHVTDDPTAPSSPALPAAEQRRRWKATVGSVGGGLALAGVAARTTAYVAGGAALCGAWPVALSALSAAGLAATLRAPADATAQRLAGWSAYHVGLGASAAALGLLSTPFLLQMGAITAAVGASLVGLGAVAPTGRLAGWEGSLTAAVIGLAVTSWATWLLPAGPALALATCAWTAATVATSAALTVVEGARLSAAIASPDAFDPLEAGANLDARLALFFITATAGARPLVPVLSM